MSLDVLLLEHEDLKPINVFNESETIGIVNFATKDTLLQK